MIAQDRLVNLVIFSAAAWVVYLLAPILTPFVAAALLAYIGDPLVDRFEKLKMSRSLAVFVVLGLIIFALSLLVVLVWPLASAQVSALGDRLPTYLGWVEDKFLPQLFEILQIEGEPGELGLAPLFEKYGDQTAQWATNFIGSVTRSGGALATGLISLFLVPVLTFYMMRDWDILVRATGALVPEAQQAEVNYLARRSDEALGGFLRGQILVMLALSIIYTVGLAVIGLDYALAIGVVSGIVSFVPYLGLIIGIFLAGLSAVVQPNGLWLLAGVIAVFVVAQMIEGMLLTPKLVGDRIGLHPVIVIFAVMAGGQLFGFFGVLLALPIAAVASVLAPHAYRRLQGGGPLPELES